MNQTPKDPDYNEISRTEENREVEDSEIFIIPKIKQRPRIKEEATLINRHMNMIGFSTDAKRTEKTE